jgi:hypothetical protein
MAEERIIRNSSTLGRKPNIAKYIPEQSLNAVGGALILAFGPWLWYNSLCGDGILARSPLPKSAEAPITLPLSVLVGGLAVEYGLRGKQPWKMDAHFLRVRPHVRVGVQVQPKLENLAMQTLDSAKIQGEIHSAIEKRGDLVSFVEFQLENDKNVGALLLQDNTCQQLVFCWDVKPKTSSQIQSYGLDVAKRIREAIRRIPEDETLTFRAGAWKSGEREQIPLVTKTPIAHLLRDWDNSRSKAQARIGKRLKRTLHITATHTVRSDRGEKAQDGVDGFIDLLNRTWNSTMGFVGAQKKVKTENIPTLLNSGYREGFLARNALLTESFGLEVDALSCDELWTLEYSRHNDGPVPPLPYRIRVTNAGIDLIDSDGNVMDGQTSTLSIRSALWRLGAPEIEHKQNVKIPGKKKWIAGAVLEKAPSCNYEANDPVDAIAQMYYGTAVLSGHERPGQYARDAKAWDTEIITQISGTDQKFLAEQTAKLEEEVNFFRSGELAKNQITATSNHNLKGVNSDYTAILEGDRAVKIGTMALVYRDTPTEANLAIESLCRLQTTEGIFTPEPLYFPSLWEQTLTWKIASMCNGPWSGWERRLTQFSSYAPITVPFMGDHTPDKIGMEFISEYGSSPMFIDPFPEDRIERSCTLGEPGSGKSFNATGTACLGYLKGIRTFAVDAMQGNVATYKPVCDALGGTFWDTADPYAKFNLMQGVDFRRFKGDEEKLEYARTLLADQWTHTIPDLALAGRHDPDRKADYVDLCGMAVAAWINNAEIRRRYDIAYDAGFGNPGWEQVPILSDFLNFLELSTFPEYAQTEKNQAILTDLKARLAAFLIRSVGKQINGYTTINTDAPMIVAGISDINNKGEAEILPMLSSILGMISSSALEQDATNIIFDEASTFCQYPSAAVTLGGWASGGRKQGITLGIYGQDLESLAKGKNSSRYLDMVTTWQIGRVKVGAADRLAQSGDKGGLGIPRHLLALVDDASTDVPRKQGAKRWVCKNQGQVWVGQYKPSWFQFAISANGQKENKLREEFMKKNEGDRLRGYVEFAKYLKSQSVERT